MYARVKKLKNIRCKSGFTLVECIVAIALLSIMSMMVCMVLSATVSLKAENANNESDINNQVDALIAGVPAQTEALPDAYAIDFGDGAVIKNDAGAGISATHNYDDNVAMQIGAFSFNFSDYKNKVIEAGGGSTGGGVGAVPVRVKGGVKLADGTGVVISESHSDSGSVYTIKWNVQYKLKSADPSEAMKFSLPIGASFAANPITWSSEESNTSVLAISDRDLRVYTPTVDSQISYTITFTMSADDYDNNYKSFADYFGINVGSNSTTVKLK